jgi:hypothetical protein
MELLTIIPVAVALLLTAGMVMLIVGAIKKIKRQSAEKKYFKRQQQLLKR